MFSPLEQFEILPIFQIFFTNPSNISIKATLALFLSVILFL